jgi:16S rRNA (cytidine1402-2'-O)-methyltransferase
MSAGRLFLIPCTLSESTPPQLVLPAAIIDRIRTLDTFVVENAKSARAFLRACGHPRPLRELAMAELNEHTPAAAVAPLLAPLRAGKDVGLLSEAGAPAVADPGSLLVAAAHAESIRVVPLAGPSSIILALMASGLEGQRFRFVGYLPAQSSARRAALTELEGRSASADETQVFIETPYRNDALLADVLATCHEETRLAVAADLTGASEWIRLDRIGAWRARPTAIGKRPAVFMVQATPRGRKRYSA